MTANSDCLNPLRDAPSADRILVIRLGALGDVVRTLPAVAALRRLRPRAKISWLVEPGSATLLRGCAFVDEVIVLPRPEIEADWRRLRVVAAGWRVARFVRALRARRFDLVVDWHGILKSGLLARSTGAAMRVGFAAPYARELSSLLLTHRARLDAPPLSRFRRNAALVCYLGGDVPTAADGMIVPDGATRMRIGHALGSSRGAVVMHPGTSEGTHYKRWPAERYAEVARRIFDATGTACIVSCGAGSDEQSLADAVVAAAGPAARRAPPTRDVAELAALYASSSAFVGSDSGPLHVASAVGTPVVQLMGPTHPVENEPNPATPWHRVRVPLPCSPCRRGCASATCMSAITPDLVVAALREHMDGGTPLAKSAL